MENKSSLFIKQDALKNLLKRYDSKDVALKIEQSTKEAQIVKVNTDSLVLFPLFSSENYPSSSLQGLEDSINKDGFVIPVFIYKFEGKWNVVNGVKRYLIAQKKKIKTLNCVVIDYPLEEMLYYMISNMISNKDNPLVLAYAYSSLKDNFNMSEKYIQQITKLSHGQINNMIRLTKLNIKVKKMILNDSLSYAKARLLVCFNLLEQEHIALVIKDLSVREAETFVRNFKNLKDSEKSKLLSKPFEVSYTDSSILIEIKDKTYLNKLLEKINEVK